MPVQLPAPGADRLPDASRATPFDIAGFSIDESIWLLPIEIAFGRNREDTHFKNQRAKFGHLAASLAFQFGDKDGMCILQGALVGGGGQRLAKNVSKNYLMTFDHDTGETLDEIAAKITKPGLFAILWTTYNHGQTETLIAENELIKFAAAKGVLQKDITVTQAIEFLKDTKNVVATIFNDDSKLSRELMEGGVKYRLTHKPMARVRSMFPLRSPFDFANRGSQSSAILEWNERYRGHATALGLSWDRSCIDPSRLMYSPRVRPGTDLEAAGHEIRVVAGAMLDVEAIKRVGKEKPGGNRRQSAGSGGMETDGLAAKLRGKAPAQDGPTPYKTEGLLAFLRANARDFEAARFCEDCDPDSVRSQGNGKIEFRCPDEDLHSEQKADDRGFMCANASETEHGSFVLTCQHSGCLERSGGNKGYYLDRLCEFYEKTVEDLYEYCPHYVREEEAKAEEKDALSAAIEKLTPESSPGDIDVVLRALAKLPQDGILFGYVKKVVRKTG